MVPFSECDFLLESAALCNFHFHAVFYHSLAAGLFHLPFSAAWGWERNFSILSTLRTSVLWMTAFTDQLGLPLDQSEGRCVFSVIIGGGADIWLYLGPGTSSWVIWLGCGAAEWSSREAWQAGQFSELDQGWKNKS